jgi:hypothetical protein
MTPALAGAVARLLGIAAVATVSVMMSAQGAMHRNWVRMP